MGIARWVAAVGFTGLGACTQTPPPAVAPEVKVVVAPATVTADAGPAVPVPPLIAEARELFKRPYEASSNLAMLDRLNACAKAAEADPQCWYLLSIALGRANKDPDKAVEAFQHYLELSPSAPTPARQHQYPWVDYPTVPEGRGH